MTSLTPHLATFLQYYLPEQKGATPDTCDTYAYSYQLFFTFAADHLKVTPSNLFIEQLDAHMVSMFLEHVESERNCAISTRNLRLAAIKSFFRYLEFKLPAVLDQIRQILAIPSKKAEAKLVQYLEREEVEAILSVPDLESRMGIRDYAMIQLMVATGLRVSEIRGLLLSDLKLQPNASIRVLGKGRKERELPLWKETTSILRKWLMVRGDLQVPELFVNARGEPMTRWGLAYILKKHAAAASEKCPSLKEKKISPHVLRHTCAMMVLQATHDIRKVSLWLGHSSTQATEVYVRADPTKKLEAIEAITPLKERKGRFRPPDKLLSILKAQTLCGANPVNFGGSKPMEKNRSP